MIFFFFAAAPATALGIQDLAAVDPKVDPRVDTLVVPARLDVKFVLPLAASAAFQAAIGEHERSPVTAAPRRVPVDLIDAFAA